MQQKAPLHLTILNHAARRYLKPQGLFQKGRSHTWFDDHGWWVGVVEFQPSSWVKGSYLNVACMWLWHEKSYISFDIGGRVKEFVQFEDESQFESAAQQLAQQALNEVTRYRQLFSDIKTVSDYYLRQRPDGLWQCFHAAIACALSGRIKEARTFVHSATESKSDKRNWVVEAQAEIKGLAAQMDDTIAFRQLITEIVQRTRKIQKLPAMETIDFDT